MCTLVCKGLGVFIVAWGWHSFFWQRRSFLVGEIFFNSHILRDPFLIGLSWLEFKHGAQDISLYAYAWKPSEAMPASSKVRLSSSASLRQLHILSIYSSHLVYVFVVLKVQSSALKWNRRLYSIVIRPWTCKWD